MMRKTADTAPESMNPWGQATRLKGKKGAASALIVLLIVLLIFFGVLALVTAAADWRLAQKRAEWAVDFYAADAHAERLVADLQGHLVGKDEPIRETDLVAFLQSRSEVQNASVTFADPGFRLACRVFEPEASSQGIEMGLFIPEFFSETSSLEVLRWTQWQSPLADEATEPSLWEGN